MTDCTTLSFTSDLSEEEWDLAVRIWLRERITPCSLELFDGLKAGGASLSEALEQTVRNDVVARVLEAAVSEQRKARLPEPGVIF